MTTPKSSRPPIGYVRPQCIVDGQIIDGTEIYPHPAFTDDVPLYVAATPVGQIAEPPARRVHAFDEHEVEQPAQAATDAMLDLTPVDYGTTVDDVLSARGEYDKAMAYRATKERKLKLPLDIAALIADCPYKSDIPEAWHNRMISALTGAVTAPPSAEPTPEPCVNCGKARSDHYIVNFADGPQISGMTWICPGSVYAAAPAPSAEQRAPVRVPCPNKVDGVCPLPNVHCAYPKCTEGTAPLSHVTPAGPPAPSAHQTARFDLAWLISAINVHRHLPRPVGPELPKWYAENDRWLREASEMLNKIYSAENTPGSAAQPAEPPAQAATDDLVQRLRDYSPFERQHVVHEAADTIERQAREIARWNELHRVIAEELDCDQETWPDHRNAPLAIGATFVLIKQRAERAEAERAALRSIRIVPGKNGNGWAYVLGSEYPTEGPGDGTRFDKPQHALDAARAKVNLK